MNILAVVGDEPTRELLPRVLGDERLAITTDVAEALALAESEPPDIAFVDLTLESGAGLMMVHHIKAIAPDTSVFAMVTKATLDAGAHAVALGGAGLLMLPLGGDEIMNAVSSVKNRLADSAARAEMIRERERLMSLVGIKDPKTSAYSLAYYADAAGREIYRAARFGRRLSMMIVLLPPGELDAAADVTEQLLETAPETALIGRVEEEEIHVLLPEIDGLGAQAFRRRFLLRRGGANTAQGRLDPQGVLVGVSTFPHDGHGLPELLRAARRRAQASGASVVRSMKATDNLDEALAGLETFAAASAGSLEATAPRNIELPVDEAAGLGAAAVASALRGGATLVIVTYRPAPSLFRAVRSAMAGGGTGVTLRVIDARSSPGALEIEALCVFSEQGAYSLLGASRTNVFRGAHCADPLFVDSLAVRLGRSGSANLFG